MRHLIYNGADSIILDALEKMLGVSLGFGICKLTIRRKGAPVVHLLE
jgi:hypothetical protein